MPQTHRKNNFDPRRRGVPNPGYTEEPELIRLRRPSNQLSVYRLAVFCPGY